MKPLDISDSVLSLHFSGARIDLSAEDDAIALALAECPSRPYAEMIKSDIPCSSSSKSVRSAALRSSPPSVVGVPPLGPSAEKPTRGELLAQLGTLSQKPRIAKRKISGFRDKGRSALAKVPKPGASLSSPFASIRKPKGAQSPPAEAPSVLGSPPRSKSAAKAKSLLGGAVDHPLAVMPITVWNPPAKGIRSPPWRAEELKKKKSERVGEDEDSLLLNAELAAGAVSSLLKDSDLGRSKALPVDEALALSFQGVASVSSHILSCLFS